MAAPEGGAWREHLEYSEEPFAFAVRRNASAADGDAPLFDTRGMRLVFKVPDHPLGAGSTRCGMLSTRLPRVHSVMSKSPCKAFSCHKNRSSCHCLHLQDLVCYWAHCPSTLPKRRKAVQGLCSASTPLHLPLGDI